MLEEEVVRGEPVVKHLRAENVAAHAPGLVVSLLGKELAGISHGAIICAPKEYSRGGQ